ncbi:hypothetical protein BCU68_12460 [Vibrio sp. 10N.286.49.B3]|uniref:hypothetical protein n=1 Tax=Vibrio sp. 10N.286.49.B3 TaxID=1880855 RepID=UPI000C81B023|nr:hypothetical protein [Vibrio sp. 10N.286.49.B3]PMH44653.1 hypothetical protein BCU68_12460 [Vibrio sp. 10N.286.49.B3]
MKSVIDETFGEMTYKYAWQKHANAFLWGNEYQLRISASDLDEEGISRMQRQTYQQYWSNLDGILVDNEVMLLKYLRDNLGAAIDDSTKVDSLLVPTTFLIQQTGDWGILFDSVLEAEHGVVLYFENNTFKVGLQGDFL